MSEAGSGIEGLRDDSVFARYVADRLKNERFKLIDVGCAGGVAGGWRVFGDRLSALGFDCSVEEVTRLNAVETNPEVRFVAGWVGLPEGHPLKELIGDKGDWHYWPAGRLAYERQRHLRQARQDNLPPQDLETYFRETVLNEPWPTTPKHGFDLDYTAAFKVYPLAGEAESPIKDRPGETLIHLPAYVKSSGFEDADFLKIDIDGPDYVILRSATGLLENPSLLGVALEVCFFGSHDANDNSFHNMDRLMREKGFDLFGLSVRAYSSAALPWPYLDVHPSMNLLGRPTQGDAIYIRDLGSRARAKEAAALSDEKLAKAAALFALFNLSDYAAEMLMVHRERLSAMIDVDRGLELLAVDIQEKQEPPELGYKDYIAAFETEDPRFFDTYGRRNRWQQGLIDFGNAAPAQLREAAARQVKLEGRLSAVEAERNDLEQRLKAQTAPEHSGQTGEAVVALEAMRRSTSWRITAPLRWLAGLWR